MKKLMCMLLLGAALLTQAGCDDLEDLEFALYGSPGCYSCGSSGYYEDTYVEEYWYEETYYEDTWYEDSWYDDWLYWLW
jgi:hypothetical protein